VAKYLKTAEPNKDISRECRMAIRNKQTNTKKLNKNQIILCTQKKQNKNRKTPKPVTK